VPTIYFNSNGKEITEREKNLEIVIQLARASAVKLNEMASDPLAEIAFFETLVRQLRTDQVCAAVYCLLRALMRENPDVTLALLGNVSRDIQSGNIELDPAWKKAVSDVA